MRLSRRFFLECMDTDIFIANAVTVVVYLNLYFVHKTSLFRTADLDKDCIWLDCISIHFCSIVLQLGTVSFWVTKTWSYLIGNISSRVSFLKVVLLASSQGWWKIGGFLKSREFLCRPCLSLMVKSSEKNSFQCQTLVFLFREEFWSSCLVQPIGQCETRVSKRMTYVDDTLVRSAKLDLRFNFGFSLSSELYTCLHGFPQ